MNIDIISRESETHNQDHTEANERHFLSVVQKRLLNLICRVAFTDYFSVKE